MAAAAAIALTWAPIATAGPTDDQKAAAQLLFEQGRDLVEHGNFAQACPKLAESERLDPGTGTRLWLADCYESNGQTASAWAMFKEAAASAAQSNDKRGTVARERAAKLEPRLSRLMIIVPHQAAVQGMVVQRDGVALGVTEWALPVPVDPGVHTVAASAPGFRPWTTTVQLPTRPDTLEVTVPLLDPAPGTPATASPASSSPSPSESPPPPARRGSTQRIVGLVVAGAGVVGLGIGTYFALHAKSTYDASNAGGHCLPDDECDATGTQDRNDAKSMANIATVTMAVGAAAVVGGALLYWMSPRGEAVAVAAAPSIGGGSLRVSVLW
jgi:serine/threonine-protein kinase